MVVVRECSMSMSLLTKIEGQMCVCVCYLLANIVLKLSKTVLSFTCRSLRMSAASVSIYNTQINKKRGEVITV